MRRNRTDVAETSGSGSMSGKAIGWKASLGAADPHQRATEVAVAHLAVIDDRPVDDVDPGAEPVGEPERTGGVEILEAAESRRWRIVVVADTEVERKSSEPFDRFRRDP